MAQADRGMPASGMLKGIAELSSAKTVRLVLVLSQTSRIGRDWTRPKVKLGAVPPPFPLHSFETMLEPKFATQMLAPSKTTP